MVVILGGGLAGLSTAYHLGGSPSVVLEQEAEPGGLCRTRHVSGFDFDWTGHLLHLRDPRAVSLVDDLLPGAFEIIERKAFIRSRGVTLPFPFQANLHGLPPDVVADCLIGFVESLSARAPEDPGASFRDWSLATFGAGISEAFMFPYNGKVFRRDAAEMTADWVSWAVPKPGLREVVRGALGIVNRGMGYNATFRYPRRGGIGVLPKALASRVPSLRCGARVVDVDLNARSVGLDGGERIRYESLVVTIPLYAFLRMARGGAPGLGSVAERLDWSVVACLNIGIDREGVGEGAHWIYFPDADAPFYRVGFPTNFCRAAGPPGTSSLYVEFGLARHESLDEVRLEREAFGCLRREGFLRPGDRIVAREWIRVDPGYVIFDPARREAIERVVPELERLGVFLAGRYGAWTYSYMERAMLDGLEIAARLAPRSGPAGRG